MFFWKISKKNIVWFSYSFWKDLSREYLGALTFLLEVPKFKENVLIYVFTFIKLRDLLLTLLQVIAIITV